MLPSVTRYRTKTSSTCPRYFRWKFETKPRDTAVYRGTLASNDRQRKPKGKFWRDGRDNLETKTEFSDV